jgi:manganese/zinc/iron transport system substrate-binding protein
MNRMMAWFLIVTGIVFSSCQYNPTENQQEKLIVATTGMIGDALHNILPNSFQIHTLMGPGVDPHLYEAKPSDIRQLAKAEVIVYNGLHLEGKMAELFSKLGKEKLVHAISDGLEEKSLISIGEHSHDPHIWLDPFIWARGVDALGSALAKRYPELAKVILLNATNYKLKILMTASWMKNEISTIEKDKRVLITSHDAFNYFGKAFDVQVEALQGISTVAEPGIRKVEELTDFIIQRKIKSVFVESSVSSKAILSLRQACERSNYSIDEGGTLYSDAMGDEASGADTYIDMLKANTRTIVKGLK